MEKLNLMQEKFVQMFLSNGGNGAEAVRQAGYKTKYSDKYANQLLNKPHIKKVIEVARDKMNSASELTCEYKLQVLHDGIKHYIASGDYDKAAKLIEISNKMQGHNMPERNINTNINIEDDLTLIQQLTEEYLHDFKTH